MSKYQELKDAALAAASKYRETGSLEDRDALDKAEEKLHAFERGAAELIEPLFQTIQKFCVPCACSGVVYCEKFCVWGQHKRAIETLMEGVSK